MEGKEKEKNNEREKEDKMNRRRREIRSAFGRVKSNRYVRCQKGRRKKELSRDQHNGSQLGQD